jgi:predicted RNase H-like HicB family nuclease
MTETSSAEGIEINALIETYGSFRTGLYTAKCRALNLSTCGKTVEEAEEKMSDLLAVYVSKLARNKRLPKMLSKLPNQKNADGTQ